MYFQLYRDSQVKSCKIEMTTHSNFLSTVHCLQWYGFITFRLIFEVGLFLLHLLKYLGLFLNRLIFEGQLTFEEIWYVYIGAL